MALPTFQTFADEELNRASHRLQIFASATITSGPGAHGQEQDIGDVFRYLSSGITGEAAEMTLAVIGAGFGRTGTDSLRLALEMLGFGPCHHMRVLFESAEEMERWRAIGAGAKPEWSNVFEGWKSALDWPAARYWKELAHHFPEAFVLLSVRPADAWWDSFRKTIGAMIAKDDDPDSVRNSIIARDTFSGGALDRDHAIATYEAHNKLVRSTIPAERLIIYELGSGWLPLCRGLGQPVPKVTFPRSNDASAFHSIKRDHG